MAWVDSMRLRRRADQVRSVGWVNLFVTVIWAILHASEDPTSLLIAAAWAAAVMGIAYAAGWLLDRHAERVVRR